MNYELKKLSKEKYQDFAIYYDYTSLYYFESLITEKENGYEVSFRKKSYKEPFVKKDAKPSYLFEDYWFEPEAIGIVINDEVIAVIETALEWSNRLRVTNLWVKEGYRRQNIGNELMKTALTRAVKENKRAIILETQTSNSDAIAFYQQFGFTLNGFDRCCYSNTDIQNNEVRLEMVLFL